MSFSVLIIRWAEWSNFGPKSDGLDHRILKSDFVPSDFELSDCVTRPILFSGRKVKIWSSDSDCIRIGLTNKTSRFVTFEHGKVMTRYDDSSNFISKENSWYETIFAGYCIWRHANTEMLVLRIGTYMRWILLIKQFRLCSVGYVQKRTRGIYPGVTRTWHCGGFCKTSIPVPDSFASCARHPYPYQGYGYHILYPYLILV